MRILFVCIHIEESSRAIPLGAASIAAQLRQEYPQDAEITLLNGYLHETAETLASRIIDESPEVLGFSIYLWNRDLSIRTAQIVKDQLPGCRIIVGGPEPTARADFYQDLRFIDTVVIGEGELQTARHIGGSADEVSRHPDLGGLPSPYLDGTLDLDDYDGVLWELSRGCPFRCSFCFESRGDTTLRRFSEERIEQELKLFVEKGVQEIFILDPTFNYHLPTAKRLLNLLIEQAPHIHYMMEIRAEFIDEELSELLSHLDCALQIGLQSIHPDVLKKINRTFRQQQFTDHVYLLHENHVPYGFDLIYGLPGDTLSGFYASLDYTMGLVPNHLDIFPLAILPGTELYDLADEYEITFSEENSWLVTHTPTFSAEDMATAGELVSKVNKFYNEGKAVTWFDIILQSIGCSPSEFFLQAPVPEQDSDPLSYQCEAVSAVFESFGLSELTGIAVDLITYFWVDNNRRAGASDFTGINPTVTITEYGHDPLAIISLCEQGIMNLGDLAGLVQEEQTLCISYLYEGEPALYYADPQTAEFIRTSLSGNVSSQLPEERIQELIEVGILIP